MLEKVLRGEHDTPLGTLVKIAKVLNERTRDEKMKGIVTYDRVLIFAYGIDLKVSDSDKIHVLCLNNGDWLIEEYKQNEHGILNKDIYTYHECTVTTVTTLNRHTNHWVRKCFDDDNNNNNNNNKLLDFFVWYYNSRLNTPSIIDTPSKQHEAQPTWRLSDMPPEDFLVNPEDILNEEGTNINNNNLFDMSWLNIT